MTKSGGMHNDLSGISTHTLTWSVTFLLIDYLTLSLNFNSHAHVERDDNVLIFRTQNAISTHTLTWSVTEAALANVLIVDISTHTLTWSVTVYVRRYLDVDIFQLTRSRGA